MCVVVPIVPIAAGKESQPRLAGQELCHQGSPDGATSQKSC